MGSGSSGRSPGDELSITLEDEGNAHVVVLSGPVCAYTADHLDAELTQFEGTTGHDIVIDASAVHTLSSAGIEVLVAHGDRCRTQGGSLAIRNPSPVIRRVLDVVGLAAMAEQPDGAVTST